MNVTVVTDNVAELIQWVINAYFINVCVLWTIATAYGTWEHRQLGIITSFNYVVQSALACSVFWPIIVYSNALEWLNERVYN